MKAAVFHGQRDLRVDDVPEPESRAGGVKIEVSWCGICGSDLHEYMAGPIFMPPSGSPTPSRGEEMPVVLGHAFGGWVVEVGEGFRGSRWATASRWSRSSTVGSVRSAGGACTTCAASWGSTA